MAAMRCTLCGRNYKIGVHKCPQCGGPTWVGPDLVPDDTPEPDKPDDRDLFGQKVNVEPLPMIQGGDIAIFKGQAWVHDSALSDAGYGTPITGDIIRAKGKQTEVYFELGGRAMDQGRRLPGWWLLRIDPEEEFKDLPITAPDDAR